MPANPKKVFVVHGRNWRLLDDVMAFLRAIGLTPILWEEAVRLTGNNAAYIGEALGAALNEAQVVVVLLTGDDELLDDEPRTEKSLLFSNIPSQPRANVLFESGMAFSRLAEQTIQAKRIILTEFDTIRPEFDIIRLPGALKGRWRVKLSNDFASRKAFIRYLEHAGCAVDLPSSQVIRSVGDFRAV